MLPLVRDSGDEEKFAATIRALHLEPDEEAVRQIVDTFGHEAPEQARVAARFAAGANAPPRLAKLAQALKSPQPAPEPAPPQPSTLASPATSAPSTSPPPASTTFEPPQAPSVAGAAAAALHAASARPDELVQHVRTSLAEWTPSDVAAWSHEQMAKQRAWLTSARAELASVDASGLSLRARSALMAARAEVASRSLVMDLQAGGFKGVTAKIATSTARSIEGTMRGGGFYLMLTLGAQHVAVDLGTTLNDSSLTTIEKVRASAITIARDGGEAAGGALAFAALQHIAPQIAAVGPAGAAVATLSLPTLLHETADAVTGYDNPLHAMQFWQDLGIPEAGLLKVDPKRYRYIGWGPIYNTGNDLETLDKNSEALRTVRTRYWYFDHNSPLHQRLRQLIPLQDGESPVRRPRLFDASSIHDYHEPVFDTVHFLDKLPQLRASDRNSGLSAYDDVKQFDPGAWHGEVRKAAHEAIARVHLDDGRTMYQIDDEQLRRLLARYDRYRQLNDTQRETLRQRNEMTMRQAKAWASTVSLMAISDADKEAALVQMIENYASMYMTNSILFRYARAYNDAGHSGDLFELPDAEHNVDDYYTLSKSRLLAVAK